MEVDLRESEDEEDLDEIYAETVAAVIAGQVDMPVPVPAQISEFYRSKDGKIWNCNPPPNSRPRAHTQHIVSRTGPKIGTLRNPISIFKNLISPEINSVIARETKRRANDSYRIWNEGHPTAKQHVWKAVKENELYAFIGLLLFSGVFSENSRPTKGMWATMSLIRFRHILTLYPPATAILVLRAL